MFETKVYVRKKGHDMQKHATSQSFILNCSNNPSLHHTPYWWWAVRFPKSLLSVPFPLSHLSIRWRNYFFSPSPLYPTSLCFILIMTREREKCHVVKGGRLLLIFGQTKDLLYSLSSSSHFSITLPSLPVESPFKEEGFYRRQCNVAFFFPLRLSLSF